jgi:hypothetical protein
MYHFHADQDGGYIKGERFVGSWASATSVQPYTIITKLLKIL